MAVVIDGLVIGREKVWRDAGVIHFPRSSEIRFRSDGNGLHLSFRLVITLMGRGGCGVQRKVDDNDGNDNNDILGNGVPPLSPVLRASLSSHYSFTILGILI